MKRIVLYSVIITALLFITIFNFMEACLALLILTVWEFLAFGGLRIKPNAIKIAGICFSAAAFGRFLFYLRLFLFNPADDKPRGYGLAVLPVLFGILLLREIFSLYPGLSRSRVWLYRIGSWIYAIVIGYVHVSGSYIQQADSLLGMIIYGVLFVFGVREGYCLILSYIARRSGN